MSRKLVPDEQRAVIMAALQYGSNKAETARRYVSAGQEFTNS
jgi:hypothetical protein